MIISKAVEAWIGSDYILHFVGTVLIGAVVTLIGVTGPITVVKKGITKFTIWIVYASSAILVISLVMSGSFSKVISSPGSGNVFLLCIGYCRKLCLYLGCHLYPIIIDLQ